METPNAALTCLHAQWAYPVLRCENRGREWVAEITEIVLYKPTPHFVSIGSTDKNDLPVFFNAPPYLDALWDKAIAALHSGALETWAVLHGVHDYEGSGPPEVPTLDLDPV